MRAQLTISIVRQFLSACPLFLLVCGFLCLSIPAIESRQPGVYDFDENHYHMPTIGNILKKWPNIDLKADPASAVSPGYHYFLASVSHLTGFGLRGLRYVNLSVSAAIPIVLFLYGRRLATDWGVSPSPEKLDTDL